MDQLEKSRMAYKCMANQARYRPQAPSDGFGNITLELPEINDLTQLSKEANEYA
jgi:hypothetical protein